MLEAYKWPAFMCRIATAIKLSWLGGQTDGLIYAVFTDGWGCVALSLSRGFIDPNIVCKYVQGTPFLNIWPSHDLFDLSNLFWIS
jgi:hypothetical protein